MLKKSVNAAEIKLNDYAKEFDDYGTCKTTFADLAKIWEENEFDVIIEPSGLYWFEMADHWPKTKFIQLCRDVEGNSSKTIYTVIRNKSPLAGDFIRKVV